MDALLSVELALIQSLRNLPEWELAWAGTTPVPLTDEPSVAEAPSPESFGMSLPNDLNQRLVAVTKANPWAAYSLLTATLRLLLFRLGADRDLVIASPSPDAQRDEGREGPLLVRSQVEPDGAFRALVATQRQALNHAMGLIPESLEAFAACWHANERGAPERVLTVTYSQAGLLEEPSWQAPFAFQAAQEDGVWQWRATVAHHLGGAALAREIAKRFCILLGNLLRDGSQTAKAACLLSDGEIQELREASGQAEPYPETTVLARFADQVALRPEAVAVEYGETRLSYAELDRLATRRAEALRGRFDIGPRNRVAIWGHRDLDLVVNIWAVLKAGAAYVPLDPTYPEDRIAYMLEDSQADLLLGAPPKGVFSMGTDIRRPTHADLEAAAIDAVPLQDPTPDATAYVIYTSGSTGRPKGVPIHHAALAQYLQWAESTYRGNRPASMPLFTTPAFDLTVTTLFLPLICGDRVVVYGDETADELLTKIFADRRVDLVKLTPAHVALLPHLEQTHVSRVILGGEALLPEQVRRLRALNPAIRVFNEYGPTEATVGCTLAEIEDPEDITIGRPAPHAEAWILDAADCPLPPGFRGELWLGGVALTEGYLNRPDLNEARFRPHPLGAGRLYRTGDLASWRVDGRLDYHGRNDHQLKVNGYRIEAGEIEIALTSLEGIDEAAVMARPGPTGTPVLVAYVTGAGASDEGRLRTHLATILPLYMMPAFFVSMPRLPLTTNGKVDRAALPDPQPVVSAEHPTAPATEAEGVLCDAFAAIFPNRTITSRSDFFALGGDSIKALQITARVNEAGWRLEVGNLFREPLLGALAAGLVRHDDQVHFEPLSGAVAMTPAQTHFLRTFAGHRPAYNQSMLLELVDRFEEPVLAHLCTALVRRHDGLRAIFADAAEEGTQWIADGAADVTWVNLSGRTDACERAQRWSADVQSHFNLEEGPLVRFVHFRCDDMDRLLIAAHHLVVDGVSWRILLEDLHRILQRHRLGQEPETSPRGPGLDAYGAWIEATFDETRRARERRFWQDQVRDVAQPVPDPPESLDAEALNCDDGPRLAHVHHEWDAHTTATLLTGAHEPFHTEINDLLLTALADALSREEGLDRVLVTLESHGRDPEPGAPDLSRTLGWFTTWFPFRLEVGAGDLRSRIEAVKERRHTIPARGLGFSLLQSGGELETAQSAIGFNYLGQFEEPENADDHPAFRFSPLEIGPEHDPADPPEFDWFFSGMVREGRLTMGLAYDRSRFTETRMQRLMNGFVAALDTLLTEIGAQPRSWLSPADLDLARLDRAALEALQADRELVDLYPLSPMQQGLLFHHALEAESGSYVEQIGQVLTGHLDVDLLAESLERVMESHEIGRTLFFPDAGDRPLQGLTRHTGVALTLVELGEAPDPAAAARAFMDRDREEGFDLEAGTPLRVQLLSLDSDRAWLIWSFHHILMDGWCLPLLFRALIETYRGLRISRDLHPTPVPPFRRFIGWLNQRDHEASASFWRDYLSDHEKTPIATVTHTEPDRRSYEQNWTEHESERLLQFAASHRATANQVVQVLWGLVLARQGFAEEALFGAVVSGRPAEIAGIDQMIGLFINTLPVRLRFQAEEPLTEVLRRRREEIARVEPHQYFPLAEIQQGTPLFDHILVFENYPEGDALLDSEDGLRLEGVLSHEQTHYGLTLVVVPDSRFLFRADFDGSRIPPAKVTRLLEDMRTLFNDWFAHPDLRPCDWPPKAQVDRKTRSQPWTPDPDPLVRFAQHLRIGPGEPALRHGDRITTYASLAEGVTRQAMLLRARFDLNPGDRVAVMLPHGPELIQSLLAVLYCGAAYVPLDPASPPRRMRRILEEAQVALIVTGSDMLSDKGLTDWPHFDPSECTESNGSQYLTQPTFAPAAVSGDTTAYIIFTSGSTGTPKGVAVSRANLAWYLARAENLYFADAPKADMALFTSTAFDLTVTTLFSPLTRGAAIFIPGGEHLDEQLAASFAPDSPARAIKLTPAHAALLTDLAPTPVTRVILGGEALSPEAVRTLRALNPAMRIFNEYGPTEATVGCIVAEITGDEITIGHPMEGVGAVVLDRWGRPLETDDPGELAICGPGVSQGYWQRPDWTAERFIALADGRRAYRTGDLVRRDTSGTFHFLGRIDDQLSLRGYRIEAAEVERHLVDQDGIDEALVMVRQAEGRPRLTAYLRTAAALDNAELRLALAQHLPKYMIPEAWVFLRRFPLTVNGKVDRDALPEPTTQRGTRAATTDQERLLARIWSEVLGHDQVPVDEDFFVLGGDSIKALQIRSRLHGAGFALDMKALFRDGTIERLAPQLSRRKTVAHRVDKAEVALTPVQFWFLGLEWLHPEHYNQSLMWRLGPDDAPEILRAAWEAVLRHHGLPLTRLSDRSLHPVHETEGIWSDIILDDAAKLEETTAAIQAGLSTKQGPLFRAVHIETPEARFLLLVAHHLVVDGVSWRILLEDVEAAIAALAEGRPAKPEPVPTSFGYWTRHLRENMLPRCREEELAYWRALPRWQNPVVDNDGPVRHVGGQQRLSEPLDAALTATLMGPAHRAFRTEINDLLLFGLVSAFQQEEGRSRLAVTLEGHGRESDDEDLDLSRTVGWFTSMFPVVLDLANQEDRGEALQAVKSVLRAVPRKGIGYGILRYLGGEKLPALPSLSFNYLGRFEAGAGTRVFEDAGPEQHPGDRSPFEWAFGAGVTPAEDGDRLMLFLDFHPERIRPERASRLLDAFATALADTATLCMNASEARWTLADLPFTGLDEASLALIQERHRPVDLYPALPMQEGMLFQALTQRETQGGGASYVSQLRLRLNRELDLPTLNMSLSLLHERHPVLRTLFVTHAGPRVWQVVKAADPVTTRRLDLGELAAPEAALVEFAHEESLRCGDPLRGPLSRWSWIDTGEGGGTLLWTFHHLLMDGWSVGHVLSDLVHLYTRLAAGDLLALPPVPAYREYLLWLEGRPREAARRWWREHLAPADRPTALPLRARTNADWQPQAWVSGEGATLLAAAEDFCRSRRLTLNNLCAAVWCALLAKLGNQPAVTFGAVTAGRPSDLPGADEMVGLFLNTLPVHCPVGAASTIARLAEQLQDLAATRDAHQYLPLAEIQALSPLGPDLVRHLVVFESYPTPEEIGAEQTELRIEDLDVEEWNHYDLSLVIVPGELGSIRLEFNRGRFEPAAVAQLGEAFTTWLAAIADLADTSLTELPLRAEWTDQLPEPVPPQPKYPKPAVSHREPSPETAEALDASIQDRMSALWCELLSRPAVGPHDSFFALGGHSLIAARLNARIQELFQVRLPLQAVFTAPTVADLSDTVRRELDHRARAASIEPVAPAPHYTLSPAQKRIWILARLDETGIAYNMPTAVYIEGPLQPEALAQAFGDVVQRHEILRTRFPEIDGEPAQVVEPQLERTSFLQIHRGGGENRDAVLRRLAESPFDIAALPLLRAVLLEEGPDRWVFGLNLHHLLADAWSMELLIGEVLDRYHQRAEGHTPPPMEPKRLQFKDIAAWLVDRSSGDQLAEQRAFWLDLLADAPAPVTLPTDRPRPVLKSHRGDRLMLKVPESFGATLTAFAAERDLTPFSLLLASLDVLIARYTGREDIVLGSPVAGRDHADLADQIGVFINTLALRNRVSTNLPFEDIASQTQRTVTEALANQAYPFDRLVYDLAAQDGSRDQPGHAALFDIMISMVQQDDAPGEEARDLRVTPIEPEFRTSKLDLSFDFLLTGSRLHGVIEFNTDLYDHATVARFGRHLISLATRLLTSPEQPAGLVDFLDDTDLDLLRRRLLPKSAVRVPEGDVVAVLQERVRRNPEATALIRGDRTLTYAELHQRASLLATLLKKAGRVRAGDVVGVALNRDFDLVAAMWAVWQLGGIYLPLDPGQPLDRLRRLLAEARPRAVLTTDDHAESLRDHRYRVLTTAEATTTASSVRPRPLKPEQPAYLIFTSGSTGKPKGVLVGHGQLAHTIGHARRNFDFTADDRMPFIAPQAFDISLFELLVPLCSGGIVEMLDRDEVLDLERLARALQDATACHAVPHLMDRLLSHIEALPEAEAASMVPRILFTGGDRVPMTLLARMAERFPQTRVVELYGPTEATIICTALEFSATRPLMPRQKQTEKCEAPQILPEAINLEDPANQESDQACRLARRADTSKPSTQESTPNPKTKRPPTPTLQPASPKTPSHTGNCIGRPLPGVVIQLRDNQGRLVPPGAEGEIVIGGPGVAQGYWRNPAATQTAFLDDDGDRFYRTGDRARWLPDGNLAFLGRADDQIQVRGFRVEPAEITNALTGHRAIRQAVVMVRKEQGIARLTAWLETDRPPSEQDLRTFLRDRLPEYMIPEVWIPLPVFPLNRNGKVDRKALAKLRAETETIPRDDHRAPRTETEAHLHRIWREVLGHDRFGIDDHFADVGGHSLEVTRVSARIQEVFGRKISIRSLFTHPTIAGLAEAELADLAPWTTSTAIPVQPQQPDYPTSFGQERLWLLSRFPQGARAYNIPAAVEIEGALDVAAFRAALTDLVHRHEILRTVFVRRAGMPRQVVLGAEAAPELSYREMVEEAVDAHWIEETAASHAAEVFDLAQAPPWRAWLYRIAKERFVLTFNIHHILADGWSMGVLVREWLSLYIARCRGTEAALTPLPFQYRDYAVWQRERLTSDALAEAESWWSAQFADPAPALDLPADAPRPEVQTYRGAQLQRLWAPELGAKLAELAKKHDCSTLTVLLAAVKALFYRYTGQTDQTLGLPVAHRDQPGTEDQIGFYLNTLALRTRFAGNDAFGDVIDRVRDQLQAAQQHADYPFDRLVDKLNLPRDPSRNALFDCMVSFERERRDAFDAGGAGLQMRGVDFDKETAHFDLTLSFHDLDEGLALMMEYNRDLYSASRMARMAEHLEHIVEDAVARPDRRLSELAMLSPEEWRRLTTPPAPRPFTIEATVAERFEAMVAAHPDRVALETEQGDWTYGELNRCANRLAHLLIARLRVGPGDRIPFVAARESWMIVAPIAIAKTGAAYVPVDPQLPEERIHFMLRDAEVRLALVQRRFGCRIASSGVETIALEDIDWFNLPVDNPPRRAGADDPLYMVYTSGSTGVPKGVLVGNRSFMNAVAAWREDYDLGRRPARSLQMAAVGFDVFSGDLGRALLNGGTLVLCPNQVRLDPAALYALLTRRRIHLFESTPGVVVPLLEHVHRRNLPLDHLRLLIVGSDAWPASVYRTWRQRLSGEVRIVNSYGLTEATIDTSFYEAPPEEVPLHGQTPIGKPMANMWMIVCDEAGNPMPEGVPGELWVGGEGLALGYWARPELTASRFGPNPFAADGDHRSRLYRTGDLAVRLPSGDFAFLGRRDFQVKVRGFRIELGEVEAALRASDEVATAAVVADANRLGAVLVPRESMAPEALDLDAVRALLRRRLPTYMMPTAWAVAAELPLTVNGKVDRDQIWRLLERDRREAFQPLAGAAELALAQIWAEILEVPVAEIGAEDDFFERGGHSLKIAALDDRVRQRFEAVLPFDTWFRTSRLRDQAAMLGDMPDRQSTDARTGTGEDNRESQAEEARS
ncbi:non-ribosomal peptide synthetase [Sulfidibacter corallicola]|uniref:Amino acid adenylation domain-containing protein n=1 Tax=Sulfidibacter corallicola TaxID=2818388 RepID=A0A8A4TQW2_SULCO|nr:non-ribosomal peptide synthetase [Sulfidibacter corallicola]QTD48915.1 amino acid adenylation domain-containing protein [Sulfidibacter corallicola]